MSNLTEDITGIGLVFPLELTQGGSAVIKGGVELLRSDLKNLFAFQLGERYFMHNFGASVKDFLQEPNDDHLIPLLEYRYRDQIEAWNERLTLLDIEVQRVSDIKINIRLRIGVKGTTAQETVTLNYTL